MTNSYRSEDVAVYNERVLTRLAWTIEASVGQFSLILAHCNYARLRAELVERLPAVCSVNIRKVVLPESARTLYTTLREELGEEQPQVLMVLGLESVRDIEQVFISANHVREEFRKNFSFPLVLWVTDEVREKLNRLAPDFESWATTTEFAIATDTLIAELKQQVDNLFAKLFELGAEQLFTTSEPIFSPGYRQETLIAWQDLQSRGQVIEPELQAGIDLVLGRNEYIRNQENLATAKEYYQKSLEFWQQTEQLERQGILLFHIGLCFSGLAEKYSTNKCFCWTEARHYFQQGIECFQEGKRQDLVAKFINQLGEVLKNLEAWDDLQNLVEYSLELQRIYNHPVQLARAYGFLAEVALAQSRWTDSQQFTQTALEVVNQVPFAQQRNQSLYLLLLAEAQQKLGQNLEAIDNLEKARELGIHDNPQLYIRVLNTLKTLYFDQKQYLEAFRIKKESRSVQQQYRLRAFVGAGRLKPIPDNQPGFTQTERQARVKEEIQSFGRYKAVNDLFERVASTLHKLIVVYGQSGVGKSSMLEAGLVPTLTYKTIGTHDVLPVSIRVYTNWVQELSAELGNALKKIGIETSVSSESNSLELILEQLRQNEQHNLLTVLIFDQFEEFFFVCYRSECDSFFEFFRNCLNQPFVKVLISLREDFLHFLLRGSRKFNLDIISNNILDKQVLYYVGNFLPEEAKSIILSLTKQSHFDLEAELVDELISDLAGDIGEVRPIELQIVGDQLQTENITTLAQYKQKGENPKEALVQRYLEDVVADCGLENQKVAALLLYLLTDENNTRPLKTRAELENNLKQLVTELAAEPNKLDLVLRIFVESGLVFLLKESPADRYQLVHDYLVTFIRHQQEPTINELNKKLQEEREQRLYAEDLIKKLQEEREQRLHAEIELKDMEAAKQIAEAQVQQAQIDLEQAIANIQSINQKAERRIQRSCSLLIASVLGIVLVGIIAGAVVYQLRQILGEIDIVNRANILRQGGFYQNALDIINPPIKPNSNKSFVLVTQSQIYSDMERYEKALTALQQAIQIDPTPANKALFLGMQGEIYLKMNNQEDKALASFNEAINKLNYKRNSKIQEYNWVIGRRGYTYLRMGKYDKAIRDFNSVIKNDQNINWVIYRRGEAYFRLREYEKALKDFNLFIEYTHQDTKPNQYPQYKPQQSAEAIALRGDTYRQMGRYDKALEDSNRAIKLDPKYPFPIAVRGETYRQMGLYDKALNDFNLAIQIDPRFTWAITQRGETYLQMGNYDKALRDFNLALKIAPNDKEAINKREKVYHILNKYK